MLIEIIATGVALAGIVWVVGEIQAGKALQPAKARAPVRPSPRR